MLSTYGPLVAVMILFYFMLYRPQKAEQQRRKEMLDNLYKLRKSVEANDVFVIVLDVEVMENY